MIDFELAPLLFEIFCNEAAVTVMRFVFAA